MSVDPNGPGPAKLPPRAGAQGADAAQARMLARVVAGGVAPSEPTARHIGPYRLVRELGRGGMGEVWEGRDADDAPVAIKVLRAAVAAHAPTRKRFLREARTAASIEHARVVRILDVGSTEADTPYIVMELHPGRPLEAIVREHGPLPWAAAHPILVQIAEGLQFAHARGVVHRDLKPANVMVAGELDDPQCTIIDFGLARREVITSGSESLSRTGEVFGSPPFMSPEQFRGEDVDARTDIYSFGCLMYFVLTGRRPFEGEKIGELMYKHLFETASAPTGLNCPKRLAPALSSITLRALRKAADDRFATAADLLDALQRVPTDPTPVEVPADPEIVGSTTVGTPPPPRPRWPWVLVGAAVVVGALATVRGLDDDSRSPTKVERVVPAPAPDPRSTEATAPTPTAPAPEAVVADDPVRAAAASSSDTSGEGDPAAADATGAVPAPRPRRAKRPTKPAPSTPATTPATKAGSELPPNPFRSTADAPSP